MIKKILFDISKIVNSTAVAQLLPLLALPIFSRLYSPQDFADFAIYLATAAITSVLFSLRVEASLLSARNNNRTIRAFIQLYAVIAVSMLIIMTTLFWITTLFISVHIYVLGGILTGFFWSAFNAFQNYLIWKDDVGKVGRLIIIRAIFVVSFTFILADITPLGQIWGFALGYILIGSLAIYKLCNFFNKPSKALLKYAYKYNKNNLKYLAPHTLYNMLTLQSPVYILSTFYLPSSIGLYSMANRLIGTPISFFTVATNKILHKQFASLNHQGNNKLQWHLAKKVMYILVSIFLTSLCIFTFIGDSLVVTLLGNEWAQTYYIILALSPWFLFRTIAGAFSFITILKNKQKSALKLEVFYGVVSLGTLITAGLTGASFIQSITYFSAAGSSIVALQLYWYKTLIKE
ncbi:lipopolysaccharide biosynthesis protein [Pseudoalteromonas sp. SSM20]|uniref:lipopolysaccharide biosynthesis protein n=1 Tax=Pseudoalteromonas sp. SSM20 TaxID=3139394 RepID=UPI003BAB5330